ncbi:Adenylate kinase [Catalinimonas alkaloidigena]|uniref:Adenylate kinase n=1 Tax=Catalinimonas alkaloidigena TaxID=1075417 RepID=A0A1G9N0A5_9BACT|nr:AAA family ATPase [Catalinimonas alkaloidigena]SDL79996.1 Adenylate kinase [Catalinimonas alkaloidigena]
MRIHIFGASGSGVTTLGNRLAAALGCPYFDADAYYWEESDPPFTIRRDPVVRNDRLREALSAQAAWVLGGSLVSWGPEWPLRFDLAVFIWIPPSVRLERLRSREHKRYGDIIRTDPVRRRQYEAFIAWAARYDDSTFRGRSLVVHETWMSALPCPVLQLRGDMTVEHRVQAVMQHVQTLKL